MAIVKTVKPTQCYDCGDIVPAYDSTKPDDVIFKERNGDLYCLNCHEDYIERNTPDD